MRTDGEADFQEIAELISRQFRSMSWDVGQAPDMDAFGADFLASALLHPSARPLRPVSLEVFADRMKGVAKTTLRSLHERVLGQSIKVFGNIAVAVVACENTENENEINRNVEMMLLVKDNGRWKIAAQAWDKESDATPPALAVAS